MSSHSKLAKKLSVLQVSLDALAGRSASITEPKIHNVELLAAPPQPPKRSIGFLPLEDKPTNKALKARAKKP